MLFDLFRLKGGPPCNVKIGSIQVDKAGGDVVRLRGVNGEVGPITAGEVGGSVVNVSNEPVDYHEHIKEPGIFQQSPAVAPLPSKFSFITMVEHIKRIHVVVAFVILVGGWIATEWAAPKFNVQAGKIDNPFEMRFTLTNPSKIFAARGITFVCTPSLDASLGVKFNNMSSAQRDLLPVTIPPGGVVQYACPMSAFGFEPGINHTATTISIKYKTLWFHRSATSDVFTWDNKTKQWAEGALVN